MHSPQSIVIVMNTFRSYVHISFFLYIHSQLHTLLQFDFCSLSPKIYGMHVHDKLGNPDGVTQTILYVIHIAMIAIMHKRAQLQISLSTTTGSRSCLQYIGNTVINSRSIYVLR